MLLQNRRLVAIVFVMLFQTIHQLRTRKFGNYRAVYQHLPKTISHHHRPTNVNTFKSGGLHQISKMRFWERLSDERAGVKFSVMSYNVLAQDLIDKHPYLYTHHQKEFLKWHVRWNNLIHEMQYFAPDILCLQEVQKSHLDNYYSVLATFGYVGLFKKCTDSRTDGCAIYYKPNLFDLVEYTTVEYKQPNVQLLDRNNVGIIAKFSPKNTTGMTFLVATTHFLYNPKREDVRVAQTQLLLTEIERMAFEMRQYIPIIITGDLNSSPDNAVYEFITKGRLNYENLSLRSLLPGTAGPKIGKTFLPNSLQITDNCQHAALLSHRQNNICIPRSEEVKLIQIAHSERQCAQPKFPNLNANLRPFATGTLSHNFRLNSVYQHGGQANQVATTFQDDWVTVDYIFFSKPAHPYAAKLVLLERFRLPLKNELNNLLIPNSVLGSDHLCLVAKFQLQF